MFSPLVLMELLGISFNGELNSLYFLGIRQILILALSIGISLAIFLNYQKVRAAFVSMQWSADTDISRYQVWEPSPDPSGDHLQRDLLHYGNHHYSCFHCLCQEEVERSGDGGG